MAQIANKKDGTTDQKCRLGPWARVMCPRFLLIRVHRCPSVVQDPLWSDKNMPPDTLQIRIIVAWPQLVGLPMQGYDPSESRCTGSQISTADIG
jgi:hypothetical protein